MFNDIMNSKGVTIESGLLFLFNYFFFAKVVISIAALSHKKHLITILTAWY